MPGSSSPVVRHVLIGGYTEPDGRAAGLRSLLNTGGDRTWKLEDRDMAALPSPTYLVAHPAGPWLFAASETSPAAVSSLRIDDDGRLTVTSTVATGGDAACHLSLSRDSRFLLAANYGSGSIASFAVRDDGSLSERVDLLQFDGSGPDPDRQASAHPHQVVVDGDELLVCDLGADRIHRVDLEPEHGRLRDRRQAIRLPAGSGPRHLVVVDDFLVVACELSAEVWFARRSDDGWEEVRRVATSTAAGDLVQPSGIVAEGTRVFVANRGVDTIAVFDLDSATGWLSRLTEFPCGGDWPRDVLLRDGLLWVSNQRGDTVTVFEISPLPPDRPVAELPSPSPSCVLLLPAGGPEAS